MGEGHSWQKLYVFYVILFSKRKFCGPIKGGSKTYKHYQYLLLLSEKYDEMIYVLNKWFYDFFGS